MGRRRDNWRCSRVVYEWTAGYRSVGNNGSPRTITISLYGVMAVVDRDRENKIEEKSVAVTGFLLLRATRRHNTVPGRRNNRLPLKYDARKNDNRSH